MAAKKNSETTSTEPLRLMTVLESSAMAVLGGQWGAPASLLTFFSFPFLACLCSWGGGGGGAWSMGTITDPVRARRTGNGKRCGNCQTESVVHAGSPTKCVPLYGYYTRVYSTSS